MKNFIQKDASVLYNNAGSAIASGDAVVLVNRIGVAAQDIAATTGTGTVMLEGVYELAKASGALVVGDLLFWSGTQLTKTATANTWAGMCAEAAASGDTTAKVVLMPSPKQATVIAALGQTITGTYVSSESQAMSDKIDAIIAALKVAGLMANS